MAVGTYQDLLARVGSNVKRIRKAKGLTQEDVAARGDFNYRYFQKIESGRQSYNLSTLFRVAKALRVDVRDFFE